MLQTKLLSEVIHDWSEVFMRRSGHDFRHFMEETDLSFSQINVLMRLFHSGPCDVSGIGEQMNVTNAAASQAVERLVQLELVGREENPDDRRIKQLALTDKGRALIEKGIQARSQWIEDLAVTLTEEQQGRIISTLTFLTEIARKTED